MNLKNIQTTYRELFEYFAVSHDLLNELIPAIKLFLIDYCKDRYHDEKFAHDLDINLLLLEKFLLEIEVLFDFLENISIPELEQPIKKEIKIRARKYHKLVNENDNIYVDLNTPIGWKNL